MGGWVSNRWLKKLPWCSVGLSMHMAATAWLKRCIGFSFWAIFLRALIRPAGGHGDGVVLVIAAGREGVRAGVVDDVDLGHREAVPNRERLHDVVQLLKLPGIRFLRTDGRQDRRRAEVVGIQGRENSQSAEDEGARDCVARAT